jgi:hypothetical protein
MELVIKSNDEESIQKIIDLARKLNLPVEKKATKVEGSAKEEARQRFLNFETTEESSFGDAVEWQKQQREDRDLPFS